MKEVFALVGDVHGQHHRMVSMLQNLELKHRVKIQAVFQVGDFEAHRHKEDLATMAAPSKYRELGDFPDFYSKKRTFLWPIFFIGGNHESYGWLDLYPQGFELIENCCYIGRVGSFEFQGISVVGLSGIYIEEKSHQQRPSITEIDKHSNKDYIHYTEDDVDSLLAIESCDILLVHDWPQGIIREEDYHEFEGKRRVDSVETLGSPYSSLLIEALQPKIVACGHMHRKYQNEISVPNHLVQICCLGKVEYGFDSIVLIDRNYNLVT